jgi:cell wall-associated NlpC family hydrolase
VSDLGDELASAALKLIGSPFRLHGRDPATGLDCVGVCTASLGAVGRGIHVPASYRLRNTALGDFSTVLSQAGLGSVAGPVRPGDILLLSLSFIQFHLIIAAGGGSFVHAHAGLRRVVQSPGPNTCPVLEHWRLSDIS